MRTKGINLSSSSVGLDITVDDQTAMWESLPNCIHQFGNTDTEFLRIHTSLLEHWNYKLLKID